MSTKIPAYDRGKIAGHYPAVSNRQDEAYLDFISDARNLLHHAQQGPIGEYSLQLLEKENYATDPSDPSLEAASERLLKDNTVRNFFRVKRTYQESFWDRIQTSFNRRADKLKDALQHADHQGPGQLTVDESYNVPDYARSEIHIQPGGYTDDELTGYLYDAGMNVFLGGAGANDFAHRMFCNIAVTPGDGKVKRVLDIGCGTGAMTMCLKERFPDADVIGADISAPLLRYAHKRASDAGLDITYQHMPAEELAFADESFDLVTAHLLFHELPVPIARKVVAEALRVLRPGGTFHVFDFPGDKHKTVYNMFFVAMDAADNGEPYLTDFVRSNLEDIMVETGFEMHDSFDDKMIFFKGRPAIKPQS